MPGKTVKQWITIRGRHIPLFEGESKEDAIKRLREGVKKGKEGKPATEASIQKKKDDVVKATKEVNKAHRAYKEKKSALNAENYAKAQDKQHEASQALIRETSKPKIKAVRFGNEGLIKGQAKESKYDSSKAKKYKTKGVVGAKKSAEEMLGLGKNSLSIHEKRHNASDTTYELRDKDGDVVGTVLQGNTSRDAHMTLYSRKRTSKKVESAKSSYDKEHGEGKYDTKNMTIMGKEYNDKIESYRNKFLTKRSTEEIDEIYKNTMSSKIHSPYDDVTIAAIRREKEIRAYDKKKQNEAKSWQDKDEEIKQKQFTNAEKQKNERNGNNITVDDLKKGTQKVNGYNIEVGKNEDGSLGKRTAVWTDDFKTEKYFNSPEKALEFAKKNKRKK